MIKVSILQLGITSDMDSEVKRITILSNTVYLIVGGLLLFYIAISIPSYLRALPLTFASIVPHLLVGVTFFCLYLNHRQKFTFSKITFMVGWISLVTVVPYVLYGTSDQHYILHPIYCIITSVMVHLFFSYQRDRILYLSFLCFVWLLILFSVEFVSFFKKPSEGLSLFQGGFAAWRILMFMFAAFFNGSLIYVLYYNHRFYAALQLQKEKVSEQNEVLKELMIDLRDQVQERTQSLIKQNETLMEYSFFNSHILRAPVSRILGLLNLMSMKIESDEEPKIKELLKESINELDQVIKQMNKKLDETEFQKND